MHDVYLTDDRFWSLVNALTTAKPQSPFGGPLEPSDYVTLLGEVGNIWPASILDDPARGYQLKRANPPYPRSTPASEALCVSGD